MIFPSLLPWVTLPLSLTKFHIHGLESFFGPLTGLLKELLLLEYGSLPTSVVIRHSALPRYACVSCTLHRSHGVIQKHSTSFFLFVSFFSLSTTVLAGYSTLHCLSPIIHGEFPILVTTRLLDTCLAIRFVYLNFFGCIGRRCKKRGTSQFFFSSVY